MHDQDTPPRYLPSCDNPDSRNIHAPQNDDDLIRRTLRAIMEDDTAPAAARAQAARTMAEMQQLLGRNQRDALDTSQPVKEMTRDAMLAELAAISGA